MTWGQGSTTGWRTARKQALERDNYQCQLNYDVCIGHATEADHITNLASTGHQSRRQAPVKVDDLQAVCRPCHQVKTSREAAAGRHTDWRRPGERHPGRL